MVEIDRYALVLARHLQEKLAGDYYPRYAFHFAVQDIVNFCSEDLGAFYLDILKDRLYTTKANSHARRSAQTALYHITRSLVLLMSPILCFTAEEAWDLIGGGEEDSVLFHTLHDFPSMHSESEAALVEKWQAVREARSVARSMRASPTRLGLLGWPAEGEELHRPRHRPVPPYRLQAVHPAHLHCARP